MIMGTEVFHKIRLGRNEKCELERRETGFAITDDLKEKGHELAKAQARKALQETAKRLSQAQELLYASGKKGILVILQGMDASGKDGIIRHVMTGINPQGCDVYSFKQPSSLELSHHFLWRYGNAIPARGKIGIFNRSHYEEVVTVKIHNEWLERQQLSEESQRDDFWKRRFDDIKAFENHLVSSGIEVVKFFLHVSKEEQKERLLERLDNPNKHWKFSPSDLSARALWQEYQTAYNVAITETNTDDAPWYIIPADYKWSARALISEVLTHTIESLDLKYPSVDKAMIEEMERAKKELEAEAAAVSNAF